MYHHVTEEQAPLLPDIVVTYAAIIIKYSHRLSCIT